MKKIIILTGLIALALTMNSCHKCMVYYACCDTGHAHWQGEDNVSCQGDRAESNIDSAEMRAKQHDDAVHGGVQTAKVCSVYKKP